MALREGKGTLTIKLRGTVAGRLNLHLGAGTLMIKVLGSVLGSKFKEELGAGMLPITINGHIEGFAQRVGLFFKLAPFRIPYRSEGG